MAWVQLLSIQSIEKAGVSRTYYPGDWIEIGGQSAKRMVADGMARYAAPQPLDGMFGGGVALLGKSSLADPLRSAAPTLPIETVKTPALPYAKTLIWETSFPVRPVLVLVGLNLLETWEVAAPIVSYDQLAAHVGTEQARERTQAVVRDLRVPLYEPRFIFIRRCRAGQALIDAWTEERVSGDDDRLCLLRALYRVKPLLCALPTTWIRQAA